MKFGLFQSVQLPDPTQQVRYYKDALEQVLWAEQLGFHSAWFTEHHFARHGIVSATLTVLGYLAGVTTRLRLGTAVSVLPFHNPVHLAEQIATVDLLSGGRLDLGIGRGNQWGEFYRLGQDMAEAEPRFNEALAALRQAWAATEPFEFHGRFWNYTDMTALPKPLQQPHPPVWVAGSSPARLEWMAQEGFNLLIGQGETFEQVEELTAHYRGAVGETGRAFSPNLVTAARALYVAPTPEQARREAEAPFRWFKQTGVAISDPAPKDTANLPESYRRRLASRASFDYNAALDNVVMFGDAGLVAQRVERLRQAGVGQLIFFVNYGGIENSKVLASLERFASDVMPQFKD